MVHVEFLGPINKPPMELEINTLAELRSLLSEDSSIQEWLENSAVAVNDTIIKDVKHPLKDGDKVSLLPPVCGG